MAGDNLVAAVLSALEQSQNTANLAIQDAFLRRRTREQQQYEMDQYPQKLAMQTEAKRAESDIDLGRQKELESYKSGLKPGKSVFLKSEILGMSPDERAELPINTTITDDTTGQKEAATVQQRRLDLQKNLEVLSAAKEDYRNLSKGLIGKSKQLGGLITGDNPPERDWEDRRPALALSLWTAYTGEKGRFSETDQKLAMGLIPGIYEKGGESKFDKAIQLAENGLRAIEQGKEPASIYSAIGNAVRSLPGRQFSDPEKQRRYEEWKKSKGQ